MQISNIKQAKQRVPISQNDKAENDWKRIKCVELNSAWVLITPRHTSSNSSSVYINGYRIVNGS